jgi:hypothetical protein
MKNNWTSQSHKTPGGGGSNLSVCERGKRHKQLSPKVRRGSMMMASCASSVLSLHVGSDSTNPPDSSTAFTLCLTPRLFIKRWLSLVLLTTLTPPRRAPPLTGFLAKPRTTRGTRILDAIEDMMWRHAGLRFVPWGGEVKRSWETSTFSRPTRHSLSRFLQTKTFLIVWNV